MKRIFILSLLLTLSLAAFPQAAEQVVRSYISTLNDFLLSPNTFSKRSAFENSLQNCLIQDGIYIKYKGNVSIDDCKGSDYAGIIADAINDNQRYSYAKVEIARSLQTTGSGSRYEVTAYLHYSGAIEMRTVTVFHINNGKISAMTNDYIKTKDWNVGDPPTPDPPKSEKLQTDNKPTSGTHQYVDLGIGTLWATTNVGAANPWDYGDYFAWGETDGKNKSTYSWSNYTYCRDGDYHKLTKYCSKSDYGYNGYTDSRTTLDPSDDAATANWGSEWRMPTADERDALRSKCYWVWTSNYKGHSCNGYIVYKALKESDKGVKIYDGKTADAAYSPDRVAHIFLPAAGWKGKDGTTSDVGSFGRYWSSSLGTDNPDYARSLGFYSSYVRAYNGSRRYGNSVRPVRCKN